MPLGTLVECVGPGLHRLSSPRFLDEADKAEE